jgi:hypothetical protein
MIDGQPQPLGGHALTRQQFDIGKITREACLDVGV